MKTFFKNKHLLLLLLLCSFIILIINEYLGAQLFGVYATIISGIAYLTAAFAIVLLFREINKFDRVRSGLLQRQEFLRETLNSLDEGVITTDMQGIIRGMNPAAEQLTGWPADEAEGKKLEQVYAVTNEKTGKPFEHITSRILREGRPVQFENNTILHQRNGRDIVISNNGAPIKDKEGNIVGSVLVFRDITERKILIEEKKALADRLLLATRSAGIGIWEWDVKTRQLIWDEGMHRLYHTKNEDGNAIRETWTSLLHPEDKTRTLAAIQNALGGKTDYKAEFRIIWPDLSVRHLQATGIVEAGEDGKAGRMIGANWDITERKNAEAELIRSEEFKSGVLGSLNSHIAVIDSSGVIVAANEAWKRFGSENGATSMERTVAGTNYFDACLRAADGGNDLAAAALQGMKNVLNDKMPLFDIEYLCDTPHKQLWFNMQVVKFQHETAMIVVSHEDITATKVAEQKLEEITADLINRNMKMEEFSRIVSHYLRAPVANILGLASIMKMSNPDPDIIVDIVDGMAAAAGKMDNMIKDMNNLLRINKMILEEKETVNFDEIAEEVANCFDDSISAGEVVIRTDFKAISTIHSARSYIYDIFYNLIHNSIKYKKQDEKAEIEIVSKQLSTGLQLIFKDNGMGIDLVKNRDKLFLPCMRFHYHTDGKGMGLYMVKTQLEALGGRISAKSEVNKGTEFLIELRNI